MYEIIWEQIPVKYKGSAGPRRALFYKVKHGDKTYHIMFGIDEQSRCELLEHLVEDEHAPRIYPYSPLPYMQQRYQSGAGPLQFETIEQAMVYVEQSIR